MYVCKYIISFKFIYILTYTMMAYFTSSNHKYLVCCKKDFGTKMFQCCQSANPPATNLYRSPTSKGTVRHVPPFSIQSQQKNTLVMYGHLDDALDGYGTKTAVLKTPSSSKKSNRSLFRMYFDRGDLPIKMEYLCGGDKIGWTVDINNLDYSLYLPLFFDGLCETEHPYKIYSRQGVSDLLIAGGEKVLAVIPLLILPLKNALNAKNLEVMCTTLKIIQQLVLSSDQVGPALVPFYRQLLPMFNANKIKNFNCGDKIDYTQKKNLNLGDLIDETLQILEIHGGEDAFINIKYMVPTYESCYLN